MNDFKDFVLDQLADIDGISCRAMFGGHGLYHKDFFFGIVYKGALYFKTDEGTRRTYTARKMTSFKPNDKTTLRDYFQVPADVLENREELSRWARTAFGIQRS
ncbi:MAG: TfoX/Sxy family protein [Planctomycetes bacterium]|nr:TfoX/Sxy family protein [Planctomycetota bacterium]NUQ34063.1 TfoX/Sxy family protein [Planctomycetaceae bacterium]